jgi:GNAT superfamily N-acetyltransferase
MKGEILVREERNKDRIRSLLETDRLWAGYALCDLEQELFRLCDWHVACINHAVISLCLYYKGLQPPTQITVGEPYGIEKILKAAAVLREIYAHIPVHHREVLERYYSFGKLQLMKRMAVAEDAFTPVAGEATRLNEEDLRDLEKLYAFHSRAFFRPYMLTAGVYYGLKRHDILVSAAGTHVCSPSHSIACLGNVFTHPSHRGRGYATICTSRVVEELLTHHQDVILNVGSQNTPAIAIYERLGFHEHCTYLEGSGTLV